MEAENIPAEGGTLFLYSSNASPLYEQDILDLIGMPRGGWFRFRYSKDYIEPRVLERWSMLAGRKVLIHFALQQGAKLHPPAFIPVRSGVVVSARTVGTSYILQFELGDYVTPARDQKVEETHGAAIQRYTKELAVRQIPAPYEYWIGEGPSLAEMGPLLCQPTTDSDEHIVFEDVTRFLNLTESFSSARFLRLVNLREAGDEDSLDLEEGIELRAGKYHLQGGKGYEINFYHHQPKSTPGMAGEFRLEADDDIVKIMGSPSIQITSRYDLVRVHLHAVRQVTNQRQETELALDPVGTTKGPSLRLGFVVSPPIGRSVAAVTGSSAAAILLGIPGLNPGIDFGWKVASIVAASLLFGVLAAFGMKRT